MTGPVHGVRRVRDLTVLDVPGGSLVVACDSVGGIGPKQHDTVRTAAATTAHFAARVALLEVICAGAKPTLVVDTLSVEAEPQGKEMIQAVVELAAEVGLAADRVTGTTEDNVVTHATGIGVTVVGEVAGGLRAGGSRDGDVVVCLGAPRSAPDDQLYVGHPDLVGIAELTALLDTDLVHDALSVGSKGLAWEVPQLAEAAGLSVDWRADAGVPRDRSAGPSSCVLVSCRAADVASVRARFRSTLPTAVVADLAAEDG
ncbi:MAG: transcriptional regulator [Streptosporangiales bacterium]|nr:transcriptional regulator [Streptosporangiales bacterium]